MTRFLLAVEGVHAGAALADYLEERLDPGDAVRAVSVLAPEAGEADRRDAGDARNAVAVRFAAVPEVDVETRSLEAQEPAEAVLDAAAEVDADEVLVGRGDGPGAGTLAAALLEGASRPVVVVPVGEGD